MTELPFVSNVKPLPLPPESQAHETKTKTDDDSFLWSPFMAKNKEQNEVGC